MFGLAALALLAAISVMAAWHPAQVLYALLPSVGGGISLLHFFLEHLLFVESISMYRVMYVKLK